MNKVRRKEIREVIQQIEDLYERVQDIRYDEGDYLDNMPENLWNSVRYEKKLITLALYWMMRLLTLMMQYQIWKMRVNRW